MRDYAADGVSAKLDWRWPPVPNVVPGGTVNLLYNGVVIGSGTLGSTVNPTGQYTVNITPTGTNFPPAGSDHITATYSGDPNFNGSTTPTSSPEAVAKARFTSITCSRSSRFPIPWRW